MITTPDSGAESFNRRAWFAAAILVLVTCVVYGPVRRHDFVNFDDPDYVTANPWVQAGLTWQGIQWAFTQSHAQNWHPLTWLSHMADVQFFGLHAGAHHLVSVVIHACTAAVLALVLGRITGAWKRSTFVAALFALHPLHVESVAWVAERKDVLAGLFWCLALGAYANYARHGRKRDYGVSLGWFALGLLCKPTVVTLPCVLLLLDFWPLGRINASGAIGGAFAVAFRRLLLEKAPFFLLAALSCGVTFLSQRAGGAVVSLEHIPLALRLQNAVISYVRYLAQTLWPVDLSVYYPYPSAWSLGSTAAAALLVLGVTAGAWRGRASRPWLLVGWLWFLGTLVPVIGLVQVGEQALADRYTYLPLIGLFIMLAWAGRELASLKPRLDPAVAGVAVLLALACAFATRDRLQDWRSSRALFESAVRLTPSALVHGKLANALAQDGEAARAVPEYEAALRLNPRLPGAQYNLGLALARLGRWPEAVDAYRTALRLQPQHADAHKNLGVALGILGEYDAASGHFLAALRLRPDDTGTLNNLGNAFAALGRPAEALIYFARSAQLDPAGVRSQLGWGMALANLDRTEEAVVRFQEVLRLEAGNWRAHYELARIFVALGQVAPGLDHYAAVLRLRPDFPAALIELAWIKATQPDGRYRNGADAVSLAERACGLIGRRQPSYLDVLAAAYAEAGRISEAVSTAREALDLAREVQPDLAGEIALHLQSYQAARPWRQPAP